MTLDRRRFLLGAGGAAMALPWLPSLAGASTSAPRCFVAFATPNGAVWGPNMYPSDSLLRSAGTHGGRAVRRGTLAAETDGVEARISEVLRAPASRLDASMVAELTVIRGLDLSWRVSHHEGCHLGNFAANLGDTPDAVRMQREPTPTIDQILAWSPSFLPDTSSIVERSVALGHPDMSWGYANPELAIGSIQARFAYQGNLALYSRLFRPRETFRGLDVGLVDHVLDSYRALAADTRLASADRVRLEEHVSRVRDVERRLALELTCDPGEPAVSTDQLSQSANFLRNPEAQLQAWQLRNDLLVAALSCGVTRVATCHVHDPFSTYDGDWHSQVAHEADALDGDKQGTLVDASQRFFSEVYLDLVEKMASASGPGGGSLLDDSLVLWTQESGQFTHRSIGMPVVAAGRAGGGWKPGQYVDYRNLLVDLPYDLIPDHPLMDHPGLMWNQFLGTVLQALGVPPSEYETDPAGGYGPIYLPSTSDFYGEAAQVLGETLPFVV